MFQAWEREHGIRVATSVHFTGGEPLLYKGLWDVVAYAKERGYGVAMMTNGSLFDRDAAKKAAQIGVSDIQVSLEALRFFMIRSEAREVSVKPTGVLRRWSRLATG